MLIALALTRPYWAASFPWSIKDTLLGTLVFIAAGAFADHFRVRVGDRVELSASFLSDFLAAVLLGPLAGAVVAGAAIMSWWERGQLQRNLAYLSVFVLSGSVCGIVYLVVGGLFANRSGQIGGIGLAVGGIAAGFAYQFVDYALSLIHI